MFPTAALLVALRLGACPDSHPLRLPDISNSWIYYGVGLKVSTCCLDSFVVDGSHWWATKCECNDSNDIPSYIPCPNHEEQNCDPCRFASKEEPFCACVVTGDAYGHHVPGCTADLDTIDFNAHAANLLTAVPTGLDPTTKEDFVNCFPPAPPLRGEELSSGAIGGIVVGAYLGVAGAFGAFGAYRGVAAGV